MALVAPRNIRPPVAGLDPSWRTGLDVAAANHLPFGRAVLFTYGPWGFLDNPLTTSRVHLGLGVVFAAAAVAMVFTAAHLAVRPHLPPAAAGAVAAAVAIATWSPGAASFLLLSASAALAIRYLQRDPAGVDRWSLPGLAALAALLIQVKFSEGLALAAVAAAAALGSRTATLRSLRDTAAAGVGAFALTWWAAGQSRADLWPWLSGSAHIASGYGDAMAIEVKPNLLSYFLASAVFLVCLLLAVRSTQGCPPRGRVGVLVIVVGTTLFAFKQGFTRHDAHELAYFALAAVLVTALLPRRVGIPWAVPLLGLLVALAAPGWSNFDPVTARADWKSVAQIAADHDYQQQTLVDAAATARQTYALPQSIVDVARTRPVSVDPWEATLPWAYSFAWHPVPVFQTYAAFTAELDARNAAAVGAAPADQVVIRPADPVAIDGRNPIWETPRYTLALACHYQPVAGDARWVALAKTTDRCSAPVTIGQHRLQADEAVTVPAVRNGQVLVASFVPTKPSFMTRLAGLVLKPFHSLVVSADGHPSRLPTGLAGGPLVAALPSGTGLTSAGDTGIAYRVLSFNQPGRLTLQVIDRR